MKGLNEALIVKVEEYSEAIDREVNKCIDQYSGELDNYMSILDKDLATDVALTDEELDRVASNLSTLIYFASSGCEVMGIRDDISKSMYKEAYNTARALQTTGTVQDKNTQAELDAMEEHIVHVIYSKAYRQLKAKVEAAQEMLATVKKIITRRISEAELGNMAVSRGGNTDDMGQTNRTR